LGGGRAKPKPASSDKGNRSRGAITKGTLREGQKKNLFQSNLGGQGNFIWGGFD